MPRIEFKRKRIGPLEVIEGSTSSAPQKTEPMTIVLFHGYGADMNDLAPLAQVIQGPREVRWVFPNGPQKVDLGGHYEGRAWFPISIAALEKTMAGEPVDFGDLIPPGLKKARGLALEMIQSLGVSPDKLVLGGFSQGAMLALDVSLQMAEKPAGVVLLSGTLINADEWSTKAKTRPGFRFFQSHGAADPVLSHAAALKLNAMLKSSGWSGDVLTFRGGHEIPPEVLIQLGAYLRGLAV